MFCDTYCLEGCSGPFRITQPFQTCALSTMVAVNLLRHVIPTAHKCLAVRGGRESRLLDSRLIAMWSKHHTQNTLSAPRIQCKLKMQQVVVILWILTKHLYLI